LPTTSSTCTWRRRRTTRCRGPATPTPGWAWDYQQFNLKTGKPDAPYQNKLVRQAISYAIDREAIVNEIYYGEAIATDNQIPAGYMGHRQPMLKYPKNGDLKKAKELMAQAGVKGYEVEVITSDKDWLRKELELVAAMVSQIGITYKIKNMDMGGFNSLWLNKKFDQHLEDITLVAPDPDATSWWFLNSKGNASVVLRGVLRSFLVEAAKKRKLCILRAFHWKSCPGFLLHLVPQRMPGFP